MAHPRKSHPKSKFNFDEDAKLRQLVTQLGEHNWPLIASQMPYRNLRQCKERWYHYLAPTINTAPFTQEEDQLLVEKYNELGAKWVKLASFFPNRTDIIVKNRFLVLSRRMKRANGYYSDVFDSEILTDRPKERLRGRRRDSGRESPDLTQEEDSPATDTKEDDVPIEIEQVPKTEDKNEKMIKLPSIETFSEQLLGTPQLLSHTSLTVIKNVWNLPMMPVGITSHTSSTDNPYILQ